LDIGTKFYYQKKPWLEFSLLIASKSLMFVLIKLNTSTSDTWNYKSFSNFY